MEKATVLIVEDEVLIARDLKKSLEELGHSVPAMVTSAEAAIKTVEANRPDLILMDIALQGKMDGIEAAGRLRSRFNVPSVYLTSFPDEIVFERAKATSPLGYLLKPVEQRELKLAIELALYKHRAEEELRKANRALKALSSCNKALSQSVDEQALLREICRIIVDVGGYDLAWVGLAPGDEECVIYPAAQAGDDSGQLKVEKFDLSEEQIGKSAVGVAMRSAVPIALQQSSPSPAPLCPLSDCLNLGYASSITLPLLSEKGSFGILSIHSSEPNAFDADEFDLLVELAGNLSYGIISFRNRAERNEINELIRRSEEKYKNIVELTTDFIYQFDREGKLTFMNDSAFGILETTPDEALGQAFLNWVHPEDMEKTVARFTRMFQKDSDDFSFENRLSSKSGMVISVLHNVRTLRNEKGEITGMQGIATDITKRRIAEEALAENEETLRIITGTANDAIIMMDDNGLVSFWNHTAEKIFGYTYGEIIGRDMKGILPSERIQELFHHTGALAESGDGPSPGKPLEVPARRKDGREITIELSLSSIQIKGSWHTVGIIRDITKRKDVEKQLTLYREQLEELVADRTMELRREIAERKRAEAELRERENMLRTLFEEALNPVMITDENGRFIDANRAALEFLECDRSDLVDIDVWSLFPPENMDYSDIASFPALDSRALETCYTSNTKTKTLLLNIVGVTVSNRKFLYFIGQEITERKKLLEELMKAQKLESVGVLAGGIAHDFNNILTSILSNISLARLSSPQNSITFKLLTEAEKASLKARDLTHQLLTFSKGGSPVMKTASIVQLLRESSDFALRGSNVRCEFVIEDNLWPVDIDEGQISQAVSNLIINADHAMPEGGVVKLSAKNVTLGSNDVPNLKTGRHVKVTIEDHGTGIPGKHLDKIFDPYFTTKQEGSGLGLASTYSIITKHGGYIMVESELGKGARFHIYLPASRHKLKSSPEVKEKIFSGKGKILVMDDDQDIRDSVGEALQLFGYQVSFARDGRETIDLYKKEMRSGPGFDAVIMDLTIPGGMGGVETIKKLRLINPALKALVSSGYSNSPVMSDYRKYGFSGVITKPYRIEDLSRVLHRVIGKN